MAAGIIAFVPIVTVGAAEARDCHRYASIAMQQQRANVANRCGFFGPRWHFRYRSHFGWCRIAWPGRPAQEIRIRTRRLNWCRRAGGPGPGNEGPPR